MAEDTGTKLRHRGELAGLVDQHAWNETPIGPFDQWPQSLRTAVNILLTSRYAMWMGWGEELTFLYNDAYRPTLGLKHPWALGSPAAKVWAEIWRDIGPRIETVLSTGEATYDEGLLLFLERSGFPEETYHTFSYSPLLNDEGRVNGMLCVVTEETDRVISERRMATLRDLAAGLAAANTEEEVLAAAERQLGANLHDLPFTLTYLFDDRGEAKLACATGIERGHPAAPLVMRADAQLPWPAGEVLSTPATRLLKLDGLTGGDTPLPTGAWDRSPGEVAVVAIGHQTHDRPAGFLVVGINPYRHYSGAYSGFVELVAGQLAAGIASARAYEEERQRAESLAQLDRAKTAFFSNVSHEFRTPLTLMLGPVEDLIARRDSQLTKEQRESLEVVHRSGLRLQRLVNTLLDFSRIEAGRAQASFEATDLSVFTKELTSSFRSAMERAGLTFTVDCEPLSQSIYVDREMWEKVVMNLLSNAFKYTLQGGVTVRLRERGGGVELSVTDSGVGIPAEELPHLFERFHRVGTTRGRTHEGTGIGLALVQELVKLHGGQVSAASQAGEGSTFTVSLVFGTSHLPQEQLRSGRSPGTTVLNSGAYVQEALRWLPEKSKSGANGGNAAEEADLAEGRQFAGEAGARSHVLLADDNADMRDYVRRLLSARYDVTACANGEEALAAAAERPPDLVLSDVMMPELDGFGVLTALRANPRTATTPILLLSARAGEESRVEGLSAGADDYLVKPFTARELMARVEAHLSLARMRRQADQARRLSEVRLGLALESTQMFAWEWDPHKDELFGMGDWQHMFGGRPLNSVQAFEMLHADDVAAHRARVERVVREGGSYHAEFRIRRVDTGATAWMEERATGVTDETGQVRRVVGVIVDVTERKAAEEEMQRKNEELLKLNREMEEFAYVASHDLQEPLRMVNIYTELLVRNKLGSADPDTAQFAAYVHKGVQRMEQLLKDLLVYSRVVHPEQEDARAADLNQALDGAIGTLRVRIDECGATIVRGRLPLVWGEEPQLALVFQNLLSNALKYRRTEEAPRIEIAAEKRDDEWVVSIRDNGIGFEPQHSSVIFRLFKRLHKDDYPGTGLGLAIAKRIVERYDGRIWAESAGEGLGAVFCFSLRSAEL